MGAAMLGPGMVAAAAGDGVTDDTAALQETANAGGVIELQPGTYRITQPLVLDTTRQGYAGVRGPMGAARIVMEGPGPAIRVVGAHDGTADPGSVRDHTWDRERFPVLSGFEILGAHPEADGIELERTMQALIDGVLIRKCRHGVHLVTRNRNVIIANCHIYECGDSGIFMDGCNLHQFNITGNHISYCARAGIRQWNGDVHNVQITGNDIEYNAGWTDGMSGEILLENPDSGMISEYTIASNTIQARPEHPGANVVIARRDGDGSIGCFSITGNVLGSRDKNIYARHAERALTITGNTIYCAVACNVHLESCAHVNMSGNTVLYSHANFGDRNGIVLEDCTACRIDGNIVRAKEAGSPESGGDVALRRCRAIMVTNNQILSPKYRGVYLEDCTRCRVSGNAVAADEGDDAAMLAAITVAGGGGNQIVHNSVSTGKDGAVVCDGERNRVESNYPVA